MRGFVLNAGRRAGALSTKPRIVCRCDDAEGHRYDVRMAKPGRRNVVLALLLSTHPGPSLAVSAIVAVLGISVGLEAWRVAVLGIAFLLGQFSVGLSNDWLDASRDRAVGRQDKPVATGDIGIPTVRVAAFMTAAAAFALTLLLGIPATIAHLMFMIAGWSYNLAFKRTVLSVLPYIVGFGVLPLVVTLSIPKPAIAAGWALGAGALLGVAAHFANVLPDLDADRTTGVVGLPHRIGQRGSGVVTFLALAAASGLVLFGPGTALGPVHWVALGLATVIVIIGVTLVLTRPPSRLPFQLVILAALVAVVSLALAGTRLVG